VEWVACQLVQRTLTRGMTPRGSHPIDTRSVRVAGNGPVAQLTDHLSELCMAVLDGPMRKGDGP